MISSAGCFCRNTLGRVSLSELFATTILNTPRQHGSLWKPYPLSVTSLHESAPISPRGVTRNPAITAPDTPNPPLVSTHAVHAV